MKRTILILFCIFSFNLHGIAQSTNNNFSITIDSVKPQISEDDIERSVLIMYITITNKAPETITFNPILSLYLEQKMNGWDVVLNKNGIKLAYRDIATFATSFAEEIKIKKNKKKQIVFTSRLSEFTDFSDLQGDYSVQINLTNKESKNIPIQTVSSNIVEFKM